MAHMHGQRDSCPPQETLWSETDSHYCDVGEVWPPWVDSAIAHCPGWMEQPWGGQRSVRRVRTEAETAVVADLLCW